jgi:hypothetical protein
MVANVLIVPNPSSVLGSIAAWWTWVLEARQILVFATFLGDSAIAPDKWGS